jgi:uncharacterized protein (DUF2147 family)
MIVALAALAAVQTPIPDASIERLWINPSASVIIVIAPCDDRLCGTVRWATAKASRDAAKGVVPLIGANLLTGLKPGRNGRWSGKLFIPDRRMRVTAKIELAPDGRLKVSGCALGRSLCRSEYWTPATEPFPAPDETP